ncbi:MAG: 3-dehydroquinate synthase [Bdellovibrionota bacterium]
MKLKFSAPARHTRVRFFSSEAGLAQALAAHSGNCLWDSGAPFPTHLKSFKRMAFPGGEKSKNWESLGKVLVKMAANQQERGTALLVAGGGAVLDLGGMAASLYRRGVPLILVPTTLLGMVDASVGGKTAVDGNAKNDFLKNFAGTFYPAQEVWISAHFLATLPKKERISGAGECWKMLWLAGVSVQHKALFEFIRSGAVSPALLKIIRACVNAKITVVKKDPLDTLRIRETLNFGHTVGHVLESAGGISHGEAVLWGMAVEASLFGDKGEAMLEEILGVLAELKLHLPKAFRRRNFQSLLLADKKVKAGLIELSVLRAPGKIVKLKATPKKIESAIKSFPEFFNRKT